MHARIGKEQVKQYFDMINIFKLGGSDGLHQRGLKELAKTISKPIVTISEGLKNRGYSRELEKRQM